MRFIPNPAFVEELQAQPLYNAALERGANEAKKEAEAIAPQGESGYYASHFVVYKEENGSWVLGNTDFAAHWVEWGSVNNPAYAPLRRAVQAAGLHLREAPRP
jgi:hypothetical protein